MKSLFNSSWGLYTDFYELTMAQGYFYSGKRETEATFNYSFRTNPFQGGFTVFAGLEDLLQLLNNFTYGKSDIEYLKEQGFKEEFLNFLKNFRFKGTILSAKEGEIMFPNEPILQVEGTLIECQLIESMLLNILNFQSLIATKAFRIKLIAGNRIFSDFGMRRAQGLGAIHASRASFIGGASSTSNVLAAKIYDIPVTGTQAHSWIQSFHSEEEAFRAYAETHPDNTTLLVDTYNTLQSGIPNAIKIAGELRGKGYELKAVRLDSGDLAYLSKQARKQLDKAGFQNIKIIASNQLNEYVIRSLIKDQNAPIDAFGIGTEMVTGKHDAALDGVYKLVEADGDPKMKFSENIEKMTIPGKKMVYRYYDEHDMFFRDAITDKNENAELIKMIHHPIHPARKTDVSGLTKEPILIEVVKNGERIFPEKSLNEIHGYLIERVKRLPDEHKRFISPHIYKVGVTKRILEIRDKLANSIL